MKYKESKLFIDWYQKNKRDLPWRHTKDPYVIWISEIILQQTRVIQGIEYFNRFIQRFPNIISLAIAEQQEVLKYWEGLGYYARARNLHETAQNIISNYNGSFPQNYEEVLKLKGIGSYTAAAIVSFAWNQPYPVIDGNVFRVISRLYAIETPIDSAEGKKECMEIATKILNPIHAGLHNQAIMEFGALFCTPQHPNCQECPFIQQCMGYYTKNPMRFPVKKNKTKIRDRYIHYFNILNNGTTYIHQRTGKDIWEGLFEFPLIETNTAMDFTELKETPPFKELFFEIAEHAVWKSIICMKHILSHQILHVTFYIVEIPIKNKYLDKYLNIPTSIIQEYPVPKLIQSFLSKLE